MLAALTATTPVSAVLAGLWEDDLCKGSTPAPLSIMQHQCQAGIQPHQAAIQHEAASAAAEVASPRQADAVSPRAADVTSPRHLTAGQQLLAHQSKSLDVSTSAQLEPPRQHRPRRPSRSAPVSPVRGATASPAAGTRAGYSTDAYWDNRYAEKSTHFDWFFNYSALAPLINAVGDKQGPCLHVGCGNSGLSVGMAKDGFQVVNVDISAVVIEQMRRMHGSPGQSWEVADCRSMPQYADCSFGTVLDKGTLDAVLCSSHGQADSIDYVNEVHRLLMPGGVFLLISLGQPHARLAALNALASVPAASVAGLQYLSDKYQQLHLAVAAAAAAAASKGGAGYNWNWESVHIYLLPKPSLYLAGELSLTGRTANAEKRPVPHTDKDMPVVWLGPYAAGDELDKAVADEGLDLREFFTAFVCKKKSDGKEAMRAAATAAMARLPGSRRASLLLKSIASDLQADHDVSAAVSPPAAAPAGSLGGE